MEYIWPCTHPVKAPKKPKTLSKRDSFIDLIYNQKLKVIYYLLRSLVLVDTVLNHMNKKFYRL